MSGISRRWNLPGRHVCVYILIVNRLQFYSVIFQLCGDVNYLSIEPPFIFLPNFEAGKPRDFFVLKPTK